MKKVLVIVAVVVSIGIVGAMFASTASAQYFRIPMAPVICGPVCCCVPVCGPVYSCPPPCVVAAPAKAKAAPKKEKKEKK